jgi:hypothetical protein
MMLRAIREALQSRRVKKTSDSRTYFLSPTGKAFWINIGLLLLGLIGLGIGTLFLFKAMTFPSTPIVPPIQLDRPAIHAFLDKSLIALLLALCIGIVSLGKAMGNLISKCQFLRINAQGLLATSLFRTTWVPWSEIVEIKPWGPPNSNRHGWLIVGLRDWVYVPSSVAHSARVVEACKTALSHCPEPAAFTSTSQIASIQKFFHRPLRSLAGLVWKSLPFVALISLLFIFHPWRPNKSGFSLIDESSQSVIFLFLLVLISSPSAMVNGRFDALSRTKKLYRRSLPLAPEDITSLISYVLYSLPNKPWKDSWEERGCIYCYILTRSLNALQDVKKSWLEEVRKPIHKLIMQAPDAELVEALIRTLEKAGSREDIPILKSFAEGKGAMKEPSLCQLALETAEKLAKSLGVEELLQPCAAPTEQLLHPSRAPEDKLLLAYSAATNHSEPVLQNGEEGQGAREQTPSRLTNKQHEQRQTVE